MNKYYQQGRPLADWTDCFQSGPVPKGAPRYTYYTQAKVQLLLRLRVLRRRGLLGPQFFMCGATCQRKSKLTACFFNILIHHNSFWNRNSVPCISIYGLVLKWQLVKAERAYVLKLFFVSILCVSYLPGYCCCNSFCHLSSES